MILANRARFLGAAHLALGTALVARPHQVAALVAGSSRTPVSDPVVRLLGVRSLVQGAAVVLRPRSFLLPGGVVDGLHAASMVFVAATDRRYRRSAAASAALAAAYAWVAAARCRG